MEELVAGGVGAVADTATEEILELLTEAGRRERHGLGIGRRAQGQLQTTAYDATDGAGNGIHDPERIQQ
jgi:hypothetical protein